MGELGVCACVCVCCSVTSSFATPWTVAHQASLSVGLSRQESWSGLPFPSPGTRYDLNSKGKAFPALSATSASLWGWNPLLLVDAEQPQWCWESAADPQLNRPISLPAPGLLSAANSFLKSGTQSLLALSSLLLLLGKEFRSQLQPLALPEEPESSLLSSWGCLKGHTSDSGVILCELADTFVGLIPLHLPLLGGCERDQHLSNHETTDRSAAGLF